MKILGLGGLDHNGSATLLDRGDIVSFLELERVTRRKNQPIDSADALHALLDRLQVGVVDHVAIADLAWYRHHADWLAPCLDGRFPGVRRSVHSHHHAHLACAFAASPFERATTVSVDGKGDDWSAASGLAARAEGPNASVVVPSAHSLGRLWWAASEYAGLPGHHAAGKTMALAAYGEPRYVDQLVRHVAMSVDGGFRFLPGAENEGLFRQVPRMVEWMAGVTGVAPAEMTPGDAHRDMAASVQRVTEEVMERFVGEAVRRSGARALCLAGGVALNGLMNQRLIERGIVDDLFVPPCTDDRGLSLGAAALASWLAGAPVRSPEGGLSPYLGPEPAAWEGDDPVFGRRVAGDAALDEIATRLMRGEVLAWFEGRDEAGPRALGHRSILASPVHPWMRDHLNERVKRREAFRPFGCSILRGEVGAWFECDADSPYMLRIVRARPDRREWIPSALHVDGTSRLHTVLALAAPRLHGLLELLASRGHPPILLNTSLNGRDQPIAHTAHDAFEIARDSSLDGVVIEGVLHARGTTS
ncbi:MAG: carbamoyltransferase C-terminal domain-containing protein [Deltaproteobacteria bacterium]|nr:carbamoyltransferase C-terminal domain-containing protein [Myxococcales bacterium]MDP3214647.1 carbamoyltransferase C-terminal domain-containing protein [Deltaproteobacteria bacterium]